MGLLVGCAMVPMALAMLALLVVILVQEPLALVILVAMASALRISSRAHRAVLRRREQRP